MFLRADNIAQLRGKISMVLATLTDDELLARRLTMFFDPMPVLSIATPDGTPEAIPEDNDAIPVYRGRSRVLEIGCSDGTWCFRFKAEQPTWIVEGVDDSNQ
jgi:hypothetical protein